jgi:hypothetical protein
VIIARIICLMAPSFTIHNLESLLQGKQIKKKPSFQWRGVLIDRCACSSLLFSP